jgi:hypothetical protein
MPTDISWPKLPEYPALPPTGDPIQETIAMAARLSAEVSAFDVAARWTPRSDSIVKSAFERECFLRCAILALLSAGKVGPAVLVEATAQLNALLAQLDLPAPTQAPI